MPIERNTIEGKVMQKDSISLIKENQNLPNCLPYGFIHCPFACGCPLRPSGQTQDNYELGLQEESHATNSQKTTGGTVIFGAVHGSRRDGRGTALQD